MKINKKKSGIIWFKRYKYKNKENPKEINGFPEVRKYKYLGIWIDE